MWRRGFVGAVGTLLLLASSGGAAALAQTGRIVGRVTASEGEVPVASAQVVVAGTTTGAVTGEDGRFSVSVAPGTYALRVARIGFKPDTITGVIVRADSTTTVAITLQTASTVLTGVVVIGYGEQEARDVTGVVATVGTEDFNKGRIVAPEQLIQGKVAGVQVVDNTEPGGGLAIRIRGGTSTTASNDPLYVIDGVPITVGGGVSSGRNPLNFLNPNDIASITILKDASSTAIYGSRAANGVVIVTTKTGGSGPQFTYNGTYSSSRVTGGPDLLNAAEYRAAVTANAPTQVPVLGSASTNWLDAVTQDAGGYEHNLGVNGRREDMSYRLGLGYLDQSGVLRGTNTERVTASLNYQDRLLSERLTMRAHLKGSRAKDAFTPGGVLGNAVAFAPTQPIYTDAGTFYEYNATLGPVNPIGELTQVQDRGTTIRSVGNVEAEYKIPFLEGLTGTVRAGYDLVRADRTTFSPTTLRSQARGSNAGNISQRSPQQTTTVLDAYAKYERLFEAASTNFDVTAGYSTERFRGDYPSFFAQGLSTNLLGPNGVPNAVEARPFYNNEEARLVSGFARANVNLLDRFLLTGTVRRDGSSRFAKDNQYGTFPSAAFAWRIMDEPALKDRIPLFNDLKLRVSWGENGNQSVGNYLAFTSYTFGQTTAQAQLGNEFVPTIRPSASDPDLRWEQTASTNVGLDFGLFGSRVTGSLDWYTKKTTDLLFNVPTAAGVALSNFITTNLGSVRNTGLEMGIDVQLFQGTEGRFSWDANFNATTNKNRLLTINRPGITLIQTGGIAGGVGTQIQVFMPGQPINSYYVYEHKMENGKPLYRDVNNDNTINEQDLYVDRNGDNTVNTEDLRTFHSPQPKWMFGHTSNIAWRSFDFSTTLRAYLGNYVYNNVASNFGHYGNLSLTNAPANLHRSVLETGFRNAQYFSNIYVEDASFVRMDNLTLGYTFGTLRGMQAARIFGTVQNVFTTTDYSGVDPTAGVNGIDNNIYPRSRTFLGGISFGF